MQRKKKKRKKEKEKKRQRKRKLKDPYVLWLTVHYIKCSLSDSDEIAISKCLISNQRPWDLAIGGP